MRLIIDRANGVDKVNRKPRNEHRLFPFLLTIFGMLIVGWSQPTNSQVTISERHPKIQFDEIDRVIFSEAMAQFADKDTQEIFKQDRLNNPAASNAVSDIKNGDGWTQPIGWLFGLVFVILAVLAAWSKYSRKR